MMRKTRNKAGKRIDDDEDGHDIDHKCQTALASHWQLRLNCDSASESDSSTHFFFKNCNW